jgi:hypothetical protein
MARRTLSLPDSIEALVRENARAGESFSAAASRLIQQGVRLVARLPAMLAPGRVRAIWEGCLSITCVSR